MKCSNPPVPTALHPTSYVFISHHHTGCVLISVTHGMECGVTCTAVVCLRHSGKSPAFMSHSAQQVLHVMAQGSDQVPWILCIWHDIMLAQIRKSSAPPEHKRPEVTTYRDLIEHVLASGNSTVALPSMLLLLYQLTQ